LTKKVEVLLRKAKGFDVSREGSVEYRSNVAAFIDIVKSATLGERDVIRLAEVGYTAWSKTMFRLMRQEQVTPQLEISLGLPALLKGGGLPFSRISFEQKKYFVLFAKASLSVMKVEGLLIENPPSPYPNPYPYIRGEGGGGGGMNKSASLISTLLSLLSRFRRELSSTVPLMFRRKFGPDLIDELEDNFSVAMENAMDSATSRILPPQLIDFKPENPSESLFEINNKIVPLSLILEGNPRLCYTFQEWDYMYGDTLRVALGRPPKYDHSKEASIFLKRAGEVGRSLLFILSKTSLLTALSPYFLALALFNSSLQVALLSLKVVGMTLDFILQKMGINLGVNLYNEKTLSQLLAQPLPVPPQEIEPNPPQDI
jgi:hypothetical protein